MTLYLGEIAALVTSVLWSGTSIAFSIAGRKLQSTVLNRIRLLLAIVFLALAHPLFGIAFPLNASGTRWFWLGISGVIGLTLGDTCLFKAYRHIGPRMGMLLMSLAPIIAAISAWIFVGETLTVLQILGIFVTLAGVTWVIFEKNSHETSNPGEHHSYVAGILWGLGAATGQALGMVTAKMGTSGDFSPLSASLIRMLAAAVVLWGAALVTRQAEKTFKEMNTYRQVFPYVVFGAFTGPFVGVTLSLYAIEHTQVGIASTLTALPPVFLLPIGYFFLKERFSWQAVVGTLLAIAGVAILFLA